MIQTLKVKPIDNDTLDEIGFSWHTDSDGTSYVADELVVVSEDESQAYYKAGNELYDMYATAAEHVIENDLFFELGIPFNLVETIKKSWDNDVHWHLYGRFDLAGGIDGKPIKLIEFNADTPTGLFETAIVQWAILKVNEMDEEKQFNTVYEAISDNFKRLITLFDDTSNFEERYEGWRILFSSIEGIDEEEVTTKLLKRMADDAGFLTSFEFLQNVSFEEDGISDTKNQDYEYWFKLFPWEDIAIQEGELALTLQHILESQSAIILNPAYTLLFQSKGMLKILWDLFPDSPYLLESSYEPLENKAYVEKKVFGREGANVSFINADGSIEAQTDGEYGHYKSVYQEAIDFPQDKDGNYYQAGVFFAYEACGLGYRRGGRILDNMSKFVGHLIK
ncbi:glutathionylspermidine synthase family protein [Sulfurimonas sp. MAG313]|nr:glutathionylspermidine synthase family protein [Sulfurimonas sp. MAG313]MDF1881169.1 glutathionylspermidine synthase family protein [Sulfurimonas sp. MAG313]